MGGFSKLVGVGMRDLLVILIIVLLVFGTRKLRTIGVDLGAAVRGFRRGMAGAPREEQGKVASEQPDAEFPEVKAARDRTGGDSA